MIRFVPLVIEIALLVYCLIDCIQTDSAQVRNLPKIWWILLIVFFPIIGGIAWLVAGRPQREGRVPWRSTQTAGFPEYERPSQDTSAIDDQLRRDHQRVDREHEEAMRRWEESMRERERELPSKPEAPKPEVPKPEVPKPEVPKPEVPKPEDDEPR